MAKFFVGGDHAALAVLLFEIVDKMLRNNFSNQKDIIQYSGFSVIGYLLVQVSPKSLSISLLNQVISKKKKKMDKIDDN